MNKEETLNLLENLKLNNKKEKILLHVCCAPCTTGVYDQLNEYFDITFYYYNPNTYPKEEYDLRATNLVKLNDNLNYNLLISPYDNNEFESKIKGLENEKEGGKRCLVCYRLRLEETAKYGKEHGYNYFTSTLSVSPYKNAEKLNLIGEELEKEYGIKYLYSDFKKKDGYKNSIKRSKELGLYRQEYCGCKYSIRNNKEEGEL